MKVGETDILCNDRKRWSVYRVSKKCITLTTADGSQYSLWSKNLLAKELDIVDRFGMSFFRRCRLSFPSAGLTPLDEVIDDMEIDQFSPIVPATQEAHSYPDDHVFKEYCEIIEADIAELEMLNAYNESRLFDTITFVKKTWKERISPAQYKKWNAAQTYLIGPHCKSAKIYQSRQDPIEVIKLMNLPPNCEKVVGALVECKNLDPVVIFMILITMTGWVIGPARVRVSSDWEIATNFYLAILGESGSGKSWSFELLEDVFKDLIEYGNGLLEKQDYKYILFPLLKDTFNPASFAQIIAANGGRAFVASDENGTWSKAHELGNAPKSICLCFCFLFLFQCV